MKTLSALYDPGSEKYAIFYSTVLLTICAVMFLFMSQLLRPLSFFEPIALLFEGFVSVYMLSRHKRTKATLRRIWKFLTS